MKTITEIKKEMLTTIRDYIIPFWLDNSVDTQYGGYITSFDENGKFDLSRAKLVTYSHGEYYSLGKKLGSFGYSVRKDKKR